MCAYFYPAMLVAISTVIALLEWWFPWRKEQKQLREVLWSDLLHLCFNGHFLGVLLYSIAFYHVLPPLDAFLRQQELYEVVYRQAASSWPMWIQIVVVLLVTDFMDWCVHNLLHRVPFLWHFHKTHHSVVDGEMDWIVSFRFQWMEVVLYKSIKYLPLAFLGFSGVAVMVHAVFGTLIGHLNHANLNLGWGPLRYLLNSPRMHLWHHNYDADSRTTVNFGIIFSVWDWLFGTAYMPERSPRKIGFEGVETFPRDFFGHTIWPLQELMAATTLRRWLAVPVGIALIVLGWWLHLP